MSGQAEKVRVDWGRLGPLLTVLLTVQLVALLEIAHVPRPVLLEGPGLLVAYGYVVFSCVVYLWIPLVYAGAVSALRLEVLTERLGKRGQLSVLAVVGAVPCFDAWWQLVRYDGFAPAVLFAVPFVLLAVGLVAVFRWPRVLAPAALLAGVVIELVDYVVEPHLYPTMHYSGLLVATILMGAGIAGLVATRLPAPRSRRGRGGLLAALVAPALLAAVPFEGNEADRVRRYVHARTMLGQARLVLDVAEHASPGEGVPMFDPDAAARFRQANGLPDLPESFRLEDYNVLLVMIETLRYDATSFGDPERALTPNMVAFGQAGAAVFHRAYAPSSGTLQSMAAILSMHHPSGARLQLEKSWKGSLSEDEVTVAELLRDEGWKTWVVSHSHKNVFTQRILGLQQGFDDVELVLETPKRASALVSDERIVDAANERLGILAGSGERFFGWVFLVSPHVPYVTRDESLPHERPYERYRQEVAHVDEQLGRLLDALENTGLLDETVVIVAGDHGEEFTEHGGRKHASTVYEEVVRVPLLVRIPGVQGVEHREPTSLLYLFPWLLSRAPEQSASRRQAIQRLQTELGPVLEATDGGVIAESIGRKRHQTALVTPELKLIYDHLNDVYEGYDLEADPAEQTDLALTEDPRLTPAIERFEAYMRVRESYRRFSLVQPK